MPPPPLEIPVFSPAAARRATALGAARIELNAAGSYAAGGLTPSTADLAALSDLIVPVRVMVRPRGKRPGAPDFVYDDGELRQMLDSIATFKESGWMRLARGDGFVFGVLRLAEEGAAAVDVPRNRQLVDAARPFACVFHRAFDHVVGAETALKEVVGCGFEGVLTSGGPGNAGDHVDVLAGIVEKARGRLEVIVGGGVRSRGVEGLVKGPPPLMSGSRVGGVVFHSSCRGEEDGIDETETVDMLEQLQLLFVD